MISTSFGCGISIAIMGGMTCFSFFKFMVVLISSAIVLCEVSNAGAAEPAATVSYPPGATTGTQQAAPVNSAEPLTRAQVEILMDGYKLDKHYSRYLLRFERYENFLAYAYELNMRLYESGERRMNRGRGLLFASVPILIWGGINVYRSAKLEKKEEQDFEDGKDRGLIDSGVLRASAAGLIFAGSALALSGLLAWARGGDKKEKAARAMKKMEPYVKYYAPATAKRFQLSGIGVSPNRHGATMGASVSF